MSSYVDGIDVSHYQGSIDWDKVAGSGVQFAYAKAAEGYNTVDAKFKENWEGMGAAGLLRGAYYFYVVGDDPRKMADHFMSNISLAPGDLPPMVDIETMKAGAESDASLRNSLREFCQIISQEYGAAPFIYTGPSFWNDHFDESFGDCPLWVAEYGISAPKPVTGWKYWSMWQYSQSGKVPGIGGDVDLDYFNGSIEQLRKFVLT